MQSTLIIHRFAYLLKCTGNSEISTRRVFSHLGTYAEQGEL